MNERICNTQTLLELCAAADKYEFNRRVDGERLAEVLDPDGLHVLTCEFPMGMMYHREPIWPDHHRCYVYAKMTGSDEPTNFWLDVEVSKYERLITAEEMERRMSDPVEMGIALARASAGDL